MWREQTRVLAVVLVCSLQGSCERVDEASHRVQTVKESERLKARPDTVQWVNGKVKSVHEDPNRSPSIVSEVDEVVFVKDVAEGDEGATEIRLLYDRYGRGLQFQVGESWRIGFDEQGRFVDIERAR